MQGPWPARFTLRTLMIGIGILAVLMGVAIILSRGTGVPVKPRNAAIMEGVDSNIYKERDSFYRRQELNRQKALNRFEIREK